MPYFSAIRIYRKPERPAFSCLVLCQDQRPTDAVSIPAGLLKKLGRLRVWLIGEHRLGRLKVRRDVQLTAKPKGDTDLTTQEVRRPQR